MSLCDKHHCVFYVYMYIIFTNSRGPKIDHCGTPQRIFNKDPLWVQ